MSEGIIVIVDLGSDSNELIKSDLKFLGAEAVIVSHDIDSRNLDKLGLIKGFIYNGGPNKKINGFRVEAGEDIYDRKLPSYSVDYASRNGVNLYSWPAEKEERLRHLTYFLKEKCGMDI